MKNNIKLTVALAVYNEEKNLSRCLDSVKDIADEIVVVDGGSMDKTVQIAKQYHANVIQTDNPPMFHINKQKALDASKGDWIIQLDADEVITPELRDEIKTMIDGKMNDAKLTNDFPSSILHPPSNICGFLIDRKNYFWGHFMTKGGVFPDSVIRLVRNGKARFPCKSVHEQIEIDGEVGHLCNPMLHYSYQTRADYWKKAEIYTSLTASHLMKSTKYQVPSTKNKEFNINTIYFYLNLKLFMEYCFIRPLKTFFSIYIRHKGFMDGVTGFEFALYSALHHIIAYRKYCMMPVDRI